MMIMKILIIYIYTAIISKNPEIEPVKDDRNTYAPSIESIKQDGGQTEDFAITYCYYLFGVSTSLTSGNRVKNIPDILKHVRDVSNWNNAFYGCPLPDGYVLDVNMIKGNPTFDDTQSSIFSEVYPNSSTAEITLKATTDGILDNIFSDVAMTNAQGYINAVLNDLGNKEIVKMAYLFQNANAIKSIQINADLSKLLNIQGMFDNFGNKLVRMSEINLESLGINITNIIWAPQLFRNCKVPSLVLGGDHTFRNCIKESCFNNCVITSINMNIIDAPTSDYNENERNNSCEGMFSNCSKLTSIIAEEPFNIIGSMENAFNRCSKLTTLPVINYHKTAKKINYECRYTFSECSAIEQIEFNIEVNSNTYYFTHMDYMFNACTHLNTLKGKNLFRYTNYFTGMFRNCYNLKNLEVTGPIAESPKISSATLDLSNSSVLDIEKFLTGLGSNTSGKPRIIKLHSEVTSNLTDEIRAIATEKNYTLQ